MGHPLGRLALLHPFPSALNAVLVAALATSAGAVPTLALTLAVAMAGFQVSIGALNDLVDASDDALVKPTKPIPAGLVSISTARAAVALGGAIGLVLSALAGPAVLLIGAAGYACGLAYDLRLKRLGWGWVAFTVAFPLLLLYGWVGGGGGLPPGWPALLPIAALAGPALHLANALTDLDDDIATGTPGLAARLGRQRSVVVLAVLLLLVITLAWVVLVASGAEQVAMGIAALATGLVATGWVGTARGTAGSTAWGWSLQALGIALLAVAWVVAAA